MFEILFYNLFLLFLIEIALSRERKRQSKGSSFDRKRRHGILSEFGLLWFIHHVYNWSSFINWI